MLKTYQDQANRNKLTKPIAGARSARKPARQNQVVQLTHVPNYLDPMCKAPMPASLSDGRALAHTSLISKDFKLPKYEATGTPARFPGPTILLVTNTGATSTVGVLIDTVVVEGGAAKFLEVEPKREIFNIPTLAGPDVGGHPTAGRAMKYSVSVVNNSNSLKRSGRVTYLNTFQRLPDITVGGTPEAPNYYWDSVVEAIKASPDRRRINGDNLVVPKQSIGAIVDNVKYHEFRRWKATETSVEFLDHILDRATPTTPTVGVLGDAPRCMSTVAFVFDPSDEAQDYSVTVRGSFYTRWPLTSVPGQSMSPIPTAPTPLINHVIEHGTNKAAELVALAAGGTTAAVAPHVAEAIQGGAAAAVGRFQAAERARMMARLEAGAADAAAALGGAAGEAAPLLPLAAA